MKQSLKSLKTIALQYTAQEYPRWCNGGEYERMALEIGRKASNIRRRLQELYLDEKLERRYVNGTVEYRSKTFSSQFATTEERDERILQMAMM